MLRIVETATGRFVCVFGSGVPESLAYSVLDVMHDSYDAEVHLERAKPIEVERL